MNDSTAAGTAADPSALHEHVVWDWPVRITHWALVVALPAAYVTHELGLSYFKYHAWCGYAVIVLVLFRLVWGFIGTHYARFANFLRGPGSTLSYARDLLRAHAPHQVGHNPLGAWMVLLLLTALLVQASTGLFATDDVVNTGPLYGYVASNRAAELTSIHRRFFYWILAAVGIHIGAVLFHVLVKKEDLIRPMFTGRKIAGDLPVPATMQARHLWLVTLAFGALVAMLVILVITAPVPIDASYE